MKNQGKPGKKGIGEKGDKGDQVSVYLKDLNWEK